MSEEDWEAVKAEFREALRRDDMERLGAFYRRKHEEDDD